MLITRTCSALLLFFVLGGGPAWAQVLLPRKADSSQKSRPAAKQESDKQATAETADQKIKQDLTPDEQWELGHSISVEAEKADTANKLTAVVDRCREALKLKLTEKYKDYFENLLAWSLAKRSGKRLDSYQQVLMIGNQQQAELILKGAREDAEQSIELHAESWRSYLNRGVIFQIQGDLNQAAADFQKVCELAAGKSYGWFNLAEVQYEQGQFKDALNHYEQALRVSASDVQSLTGVAHCLVQLKQAEKAIEKYTVVIRMRPDSSAALINRGDAYQTRADWKRAYDDYSQAAKLDESPLAYQRAAWLLATCPEVEFFQPETALLLAGKAVEADSVDPSAALETLAAAQAACGDFESAVATQRKAMAIASESIESLEKRLALYQDEKPFQQTRKR